MTGKQAPDSTNRGGGDAPVSIRLDKWLWFARFFKTRGLAAKTVSSGQLRVNGTPVAKPSYALRVGDTLTFVQARAVRVVRVEALGTRRGPAPEAQALYTDLSPPPPPRDDAAPQPRAGGRPTGKARRDFDAQRGAQSGDGWVD